MGIRDSFNLTQLVQITGERVASQAEQADLAFEMQLPHQPIVIRGDESQLQRALVNVLDNSLKFTPPPGKIVLALATEGETAAITVRDTGIGIPMEDVPQLFNRFHRGHNTAGYAGSGLGLAIVREIMARHNGRVAIESGDWGTEVKLVLPFVFDEEPRNDADESTPDTG
jgi:signal transduction histidine kinase